MKFECDVDVDFNGIVIFVYPSLLSLFEGKIISGQNILEEFTTTDKGDEILDQGFALPIMGIDDGSYRVRFFVDESPEGEKRKIIFEDKFFICLHLMTYISQIWRFFGIGKNIPVGKNFRFLAGCTRS